jgi:hypothetical protein
MTPLPPTITEASMQALCLSWESLYKQKAQLHFYFSAKPELLNDYQAILKQSFKRPYTLLKGNSRI